jgi:hypothetical protein
MIHLNSQTNKVHIVLHMDALPIDLLKGNDRCNPGRQPTSSNA